MDPPGCPVHTGQVLFAVRCASGETARQRNGRLTTEQCADSSRRVSAAPEGAPDSEQCMSGAPPDIKAGPKSELQRSISNGTDDVAGAPDCPVRHRTDSLPTTTFGGWGYKYPNHPTIHCIQVFYFSTTTRALAFNSRHTKEIKSSPNSTQRHSD